MSFLFEALVWKLLATAFIDFLAVNTERETGAVHRQGPERQQQQYTDRDQRNNSSTQTGIRETTAVQLRQGSGKVVRKDGGRCTVQ